MPQTLYPAGGKPPNCLTAGQGLAALRANLVFQILKDQIYPVDCGAVRRVDVKHYSTEVPSNTLLDPSDAIGKFHDQGDAKWIAIWGLTARRAYFVVSVTIY
jgi:hypothetical protein